MISYGSQEWKFGNKSIDIKSDSARIINGICRCTHATTSDVCDCCTTNITCEYLIDKYYTQVVNTLVESGIATVPIIQPGTEKHWWSHELNELKQKSIDAFCIWKDAGRPRSGVIFNIYKDAKYAYKLCINRSRREKDLSISNELHEALCSKDNTHFWNSWKSKFKSNTKACHAKIVSGLTDSSEIANGFSNYFGNTCKPNTQSYNVLKIKEFNNKLVNYFGDILTCDDLLTIELVCKVICELKTGRASGLDGVTTEHLLYCHPSVHLLITILCNLILMSGHVPSQFAVGLTFPLEKGNLGNKQATFDDYRGITISPIISKILEKCILERFEKYFISSDNQFGFKKKVGCSHAIYSLRSTVDYFVNNNSTVNLCSIDISKAFDRVNHYSLFIKLMTKCVPINIVIMLLNWYKQSAAIVSWNGILSSSYRLSSGVRQGGCLSPVLFAGYVDTIIQSIQKHCLGCHIGLRSMGVIMYADDLLLISGSVTDLQAMINICMTELSNLDLTVNPKKSVCMRIGKNFKASCSNVSIESIPIPWSNRISYLGITIRSSFKLMVDLKESRAKFYRSFNCLYSKIYLANEYLIVSLIKSFCTPVIMHSICALNLNAFILNGLDNLLYNTFGKIFKTFDHKILNSCMFYMNCWPMSSEFHCRKINFLIKLNKIENECTRTWFEISGRRELSHLCNELTIESHSASQIKKDIWSSFSRNAVFV